MFSFYRSKKDFNKLYLCLGECIDVSNDVEKEMIYFSEIKYNCYGQRYVCDKKKFLEMFDLIKESDDWPSEQLFKKFS
jgi:hypothetical protein